MSDWIQIVVLSSIAIACGLIGPFLVLRRMAMFANALSHTILLGIAIAFLLTGGLFFDLSNLLMGAFLAALMTAFLTGGLVHLFRLQEDASIGLVFTALFALGITVVTLFMKEAHIGIEAVMGNADILQWSDLKIALSLVGVNLLSILVWYKPFQLTSFDLNLAKTLGFRGGFYQFLLLFLAAFTCIGAFRAVGVLLVLGFLVGPYLTARLFFHRLPHLLVATSLIGVLISCAGVGISRLCLDLFELPLSTGGIISTLIGITFIVAKWIRSVTMLSCEKQLPS